MTTDKNLALYRYLHGVFGSAPDVRRVLDETHTTAIDVAIAKNVPEAGVNTYSTIGMSDLIFRYEDGTAFDFGMELIASDDGTNDFIPDLLFEVYRYALANPDWNCTPGSVLRDVVTPWKKGTSLPHAYFTGSFYIEELSELQTFLESQVIWAMMIPISQAELEYLEANGDDAFETMLEEGAVNILDYERESLL